MRKKIYFILAFVVFYSCDQKSVSSLDGDAQLEKNFNSCVNSLQGEMIDLQSITDVQATNPVDSDVPNANNSIANAELDDIDFERESIGQSSDLQYTRLGISKKFIDATNSYHFIVNLEFDESATFATAGNQKIPLLRYTTKIDIQDSQNIGNYEELTHSYSVDYQNGCAKSLTNIFKNTINITPGNDQGTEDFWTSDLQSNPATESVNVSLDALEEKNNYYDQLSSNDISGLAGEQFLLGNNDEDPDAMTIVFGPLQQQQKNDPVINATTLFNYFTMTLSVGSSQKIDGSFYGSTASQYRVIVGDTISENFIPQAAWQSTQLTFKNAGRQALVGFSSQDFKAYDNGNAGTLSYQVISPVSLDFDNYDAYFDFSSNGSITSDNGTDSYNYSVKIRQPANTSLDSPFSGSVPDGYQQYVQGTKYYNINDPQLVPITAGLKNMISANKSQRDVITEMLNVVNQAISYDMASVATDAISTEKSSDILSSHKGVCQHYAAVFVTIARSLNIPSRMITGLSLSYDDATNSGKLEGHAWAEILINGNYWLPIDPEDQVHLHLNSSGYFPYKVAYEYEEQEQAAGEGENFAMAALGGSDDEFEHSMVSLRFGSFSQNVVFRKTSN